MQRAECLLPFVVRNFSRHDYTRHNPDLTQIQIDELQKALPKCPIFENAKK